MLINKINEIKLKLNLGVINYEDAKKEACPIIKKMNLKSKEIAKKYNKKPQIINFSILMR